MKAKKIITGIMVIGMTFGITGFSFAASKDVPHKNNQQTEQRDKRQDKQSDRIYQGIKTGKITSHEYKKNLMQEQARIEQAKKRDFKGGHLAKREQEKFNWMHKKSNYNNYEVRHNRQAARDYRHNSRNRY